MAKRTTGQQIMKDNPAGGDRINFREVMVDLKPDAASGRTVKRLRLIGDPIAYREATPRKREADGKKTIPCAFPDAAVNKSFTRVCDDDLDKDIWNQMGYVTTQRFAINVIDCDDGKIKILAKGRSIFKKFAEQEASNAEENLEMESGEELLWTRVGGVVAPEIKITAIKNDQALGGVEYSVFFTPKMHPLSDEEIEKLRAVGTPTPEELKALKSEYPDDPEWFFYGHNLEKIFKPSVLRTPNVESAPEATTPTEEMAIAVDEPEDAEDIEDTATTETSAPKAPKAPKAKVEKADTEEEELAKLDW